MLGSSRTVRGDKLVAHEFVLLRERGEQLAYEMQPSGQPGQLQRIEYPYRRVACAGD